MVDFRKLRNDRATTGPINPEDIFLRLPRSTGINDLWKSQAEALSQWFARRDERDVVIKLNTGGGKTLVGLLVAQSTMYEKHGPVVYLCPVVQLVKQTIALAKRYGIRAVPYERGEELDEEFLRGKAVLVATYRALFNGLTRFGLAGGQRNIIQLEGIVLDDAHAAFEVVRDAFTLSVSSIKYNDLYTELTQSFRGDFADLGKQGTFDDVVSGKDQTVLEIPYWSWLARFGELRERLRTLEREDDFVFNWPLVRDTFHLCHALITSQEFAVTPICPMVDMFPSFAECPRRVYMSATVADDSSIVRTFDASVASTSKPISPTSLAGVGERMILMPQWTKIERTRLMPAIKNIIDRVAGSYGVALLVPSARIASTWEDLGTVVDGADVEKRVKDLVERKSNGPFVFVNRYDGIDLPEDACRLLLLANTPRGGNTYDLYRATVFEGSSVINTTIAQRVEQGMGRGTRGGGDHCVVLLFGADLLSWISQKSNLRLLTRSACAQLEMGGETSREIRTERDLWDTIQKCLERDDDWVKYHAQVLGESVSAPMLHSQNLEAAECERKLFRLARDNHYAKAIAVARKYVQDGKGVDTRVKGWILQLAAHVAYLWGNTSTSEELQQEAYANNHALFRPKAIPAYERLRMPTKQSANIVSRLRDFEQREGWYARFEEVADWLTSDATSNQFEESLKDLGTSLGFEVQRPDHEFRKGPDVLWIMTNKTALVIEAKSRKNEGKALTKEDHGQLLQAYEWFQQTYPDIAGFRVAIAPQAKVTATVTPGDSYVLTLAELGNMVGRVRQLIKGLVDSPLEGTRLEARCDELLGVHELTPPLLVSRFLKRLQSA
jgi:replicative superfamily II helicase